MADQAKGPPGQARPVRFCCPDARRVGRRPMPRRRLTLTGVKPCGAVPDRVETCSVDGAVEPPPAERGFLALPSLDATTCQMVWDAFARGDQETRQIVRMEHGGGHTATSRVIPHHVGCRFFPPYCPERTPSERVWQDLHDPWAWRLAGTLAARAHQGARRITDDTNAARQALTAYP